VAPSADEEPLDADIADAEVTATVPAAVANPAEVEDIAGAVDGTEAPPATQTERTTAAQRAEETAKATTPPAWSGAGWLDEDSDLVAAANDPPSDAGRATMGAWPSRPVAPAAGREDDAGEPRRMTDAERAAQARAAEEAARLARAQAERRAMVALIAIIVALVGVLLLVRVSGPDQRHPSTTASVAVVSATVTNVTPSAPSDTVADSSTPVTPPAGWLSYRDPTGWSITYPASWKVVVGAAGAGTVDFQDPATRAFLRVVNVSPPPASELDWLRGVDTALFPVTFHGYERLRLAASGGGTGATQADLEFTGQQNGGAFHVLDRGVIRHGHGYLLYWQAGTAQWSADQALRLQMYASFRPAP
jgi:hypothetical protein